MIRKKLSRKERLLWGGSLLVLTVVFFFFFKKHTNGMGRLSCRSKCSYILRPGRAGQTGTYDRIQYFVRDPVFPVRLLWGNDYLFGDERAHGSSIHGFLAASPL